jgi:Ni/Fe-hydrogenase subunit HybB-like protein
LTFWWWEIVLGLVAPAVILLMERLRRDDRAVLVGLGLLVFGVIVNRWNTTLSGLIAPPTWSPGVLGSVVTAAYAPTWVEVAVSAGIIGYAWLAFTLAVRYLRIYEGPSTEHA